MPVRLRFNVQSRGTRYAAGLRRRQAPEGGVVQPAVYMDDAHVVKMLVAGEAAVGRCQAELPELYRADPAAAVAERAVVGVFHQIPCGIGDHDDAADVVVQLRADVMQHRRGAGERLHRIAGEQVAMACEPLC